jgi:Cu/Ag efflux protein CusF
MKRIALVLVASLAAAPALAQNEHRAVAAVQVAQAAAKDLAEGEVRKIDKAGKKITIKHGEIKSVGMGPMTMTFDVADPALLGKVAVNDKVRFQAAQKDGKLVVTAIEKAK